MRRVVFVSLVLLIASSARADDAAPVDSAADLTALITAHHCGQAYPLAVARIAEQPHSARLRCLAALCAIRLVMRDEARTQLDAGIADHPRDANLLAESSRLSLLEGDLEGAHNEATRALAISPHQSTATSILALVDTFHRAVAHSRGASPVPPGTATSVADHVLELLFAGSDGDDLQPFVDPEVLPESERRSGALHELVAGAREGVARNGQEFKGWLVTGTRPGDGDHVWVDISLPVRVTTTASNADQLGKMYADPTLRDMVAPDARQMLAEVDDAERPALLDRLVGLTTTTVMPCALEMAPHDGSYWIVGAIFDGTDERKFLAAYANNVGNVQRFTPENERPRRIAWWLPYGIGAVVLGALGAGLLIALRGRSRR